MSKTITITIQEVWCPPGKEFPKVLTTPEKKKYHLYEDQAELAEHIKVGHQIAILPLDTTNAAGKPINRIQNVYVDGKPVIAQEQPPAKAPKRQAGEGITIRDNSQKSFACSYAKDVVVAIIKTSDKHFDIEKITPKQARGIANLIKAIANDLNAWLISSSEIVEKIEKTIEEG